MSCGIYAIINAVNERPYIGSSGDIEERFNGYHLPALRKGEHGNPHLQNAFNKYGEENFYLVILELTTEVNRLEWEQRYIDDIGIENLYNISPTAGGGYTGPFSKDVLERMRGRKISEKTREKLSEAHRGIPLSAEHRKKIGEAGKGKIVSEKTRRMMRKKMKGRGEGRKLTKEHRKNISKSLKGNKRSLGYEYTKEQREKVSRGLMGNQNTLGYKPTEETKEKIRDKLKKNWRNQYV
ncbi:hypothetical protein LCGC14_2277090 [marine sediment metagenome]|uniref:GIY-YIG domain-containing protein n=1 Tax=marine sediment metagenome TaxID=412755 RepID=A0A0F9CVB7_9ZZZZ